MVHPLSFKTAAGDLRHLKVVPSGILRLLWAPTPRLARHQFGIRLSSLRWIGCQQRRQPDLSCISEHAKHMHPMDN
jgi:hypothetical protein